MNTLFKQNSSVFPLMFMMVQTDGVSPATGLTPTVVISKNGGAFASPGGAVSELANGWYEVAANATDSNTLGPLILHATATGANNTDADYLVVAFDPTAAAASVNVTQAAGQTVSASAAVNFDQLGFIGETTVRRGTCQSGSASTNIVFDSGASGQGNYYVDMMAVIVGGTGAGQARLITAYNGSSQTATIYPGWTTTPDNTSKFLVVSETQADVGRLANCPVLASSGVIFPFTVAGSATGAVSLASGGLDISAMTFNLASLLLRQYLVSTGTTSPVTADQWSVGGMYNNLPYYTGKSSGFYIWNDGSAWNITEAPGLGGGVGPSWKTGSGANIAGPYTAISPATGTPTLAAHGNAILNSFQPDIPFPTNFGSMVIGGGAANANVVQIAGQTASASASVTFPAGIGTSTFASGGSVNATQIGGQNVQLDGQSLLKVDAAAFLATPNVNVTEWNGTAVTVNSGLPSVNAGNSGSGSGPIAINQNTGGTDNLRYVDSAGNGIGEATVLIYLAADWPSQPEIVQATAETGPDGRWLSPAFVQSGTYVAVFTKIGAVGPNVSGPFSV
jgi:hypothetical protein